MLQSPTAVDNVDVETVYGIFASMFGVNVDNFSWQKTPRKSTSNGRLVLVEGVGPPVVHVTVRERYAGMYYRSTAETIHGEFAPMLTSPFEF